MYGGSLRCNIAAIHEKIDYALMLNDTPKVIIKLKEATN